MLISPQDSLATQPFQLVENPAERPLSARATHPPQTHEAPDRPRRDLINDLRRTIQNLEGRGPVLDGDRRPGVISTGSPVLDAALPWNGLPTGCLHEVMAETAPDSLPRSLAGGPATGFAAAMAARLAGRDGTVLWCRRGVPPHAPGVARLGLDPVRLILVEGRDDTDILWAMEEGLRGGGPAVVLGELDHISLTAGRRLQLAAETGGGTALLLRGPANRGTRPSPGTAVTRWAIGSALSGAGHAVGTAWRLSLFHCRHRLTGDKDQWRMEWNDETGDFRVAAGPCHRSGGTDLAAGGARIIPFAQRRAG